MACSRWHAQHKDGVWRPQFSVTLTLVLRHRLQLGACITETRCDMVVCCCWRFGKPPRTPPHLIMLHSDLFPHLGVEHRQSVTSLTSEMTRHCFAGLLCNSAVCTSRPSVERFTCELAQWNLGQPEQRKLKGSNQCRRFLICVREQPAQGPEDWLGPGSVAAKALRARTPSLLAPAQVALTRQTRGSADSK